MEWIESTKPIFKQISKEKGIKLVHDTHYDAENFEFSILRGREMHRLDFQPEQDGSFVITKYIDLFPFMPRLLKFCHNTIPLFPYVAKINFEKLGNIEPEVKGLELKKRITEYIEKNL